MKKNKLSNQSLADISVRDSAHDKLKFAESIVPRIFNIISDKTYFPLTISITGEWGAGKTSVINLLKNKLTETSKKETNVIITFDPLVEGKQSIAELIELFYLKIIQEIKNDKVKDVFKKLLTSMLTLTRCKTNLQVQDPVQLVTIGMEYDLGKNIDKIIDIWKKNEPKILSEHAKEINSILASNNINLYVFIDEIDRLSSEQIIAFLLFSRVIESIEYLVCIVGLDYNRTLRKLIVEKRLGTSNYSDVKFYLDKLITLSFHVEATLNNRSELLGELLIDHKILSKEVVNQYAMELREISDYLSTPRGIKKLLILICANREIMHYSQNKLAFIRLLAIEVVNPIIKEYLTKYEEILYSRDFNKSLLLNNITSSKDFEGKDNGIINKIILGIVDSKLNEDDFRYFRKQIPYIITDTFNNKYISEIIDTIPHNIMHAYIRSYYELETLKIYFEFFQGNCNEAIKLLVDSSNQIIADDISYALHKKNSPSTISNDIDPEVLNKLWMKETNYLVGSPYTHIALYLAPQIPLEKFIEMVSPTFSESFLHRILKISKIENKKGVYNIEDFDNSEFQNDALKIVTFNNTLIQKFSIETIKEIITLWLGKLSDLILNDKLDYSMGDQTLNLLYRFVQWGNSVGNDNRMIINDAVERFLNSKKISTGSKICFAKSLINANAFNAHFYQDQDDDKIFKELFGSTKLKSRIFSLAGK